MGVWPRMVGVYQPMVYVQRAAACSCLDLPQVGWSCPSLLVAVESTAVWDRSTYYRKPMHLEGGVSDVPRLQGPSV